MLRLQRNMHDPFDTFYATERWALKFRAFFVALAAYVVLCLFLFAKSWLPGAIPTVMVRSGAAPVLFLSNNSKKGRGLSGVRKHGATGSALASTKKKGAKVESKKAKPQKPVQKKIKVPQQKPKQKVEEKKVVKGGDAARKKIAPSAPPVPPKKLEKKNNVTKEEKKIEPLPEKSFEKKEEPKIEKVPEAPPIAAPIEKEIEIVEEKTIETPQDVFVGQEIEGDESSYDATTKAHMALSRAVARTWRPPRVQIKKQVRVIAEVDGAGSVLDAVLEQKSDVVVYDIAARAAVLRAEFPREFWGKKVAIVFGN